MNKCHVCVLLEMRDFIDYRSVLDSICIWGGLSWCWSHLNEEWRNLGYLKENRNNNSATFQKSKSKEVRK